MRRALAIAVAALALALPALAGGPSMLIGVAEDNVKQDTAAAAKAEMDLIRLAGMNAVRITSIWAPGLTAPTAAELRKLRNVSQAARLDGVRVIVEVMNFGSATTPLSEADRAAFASYAAAIARARLGFADFIIGNEPNLNRFWLPQFNPDGSDAAAPAYETLLAQTYDALKAVDPSINVIGGAVSPRGIDRPNTGRDTHSPTAFVADLGAAYRASGRTLPIMDEFAFHPYQDNSSQPPSFQHPKTTTISLADYGKLVALVGKAFDGTAQSGSTLPILFDEYGVESVIPPEKASLYAGTEPATIKPVDEPTQGAYYLQALQLAFCQPNVKGFFLFHSVDEAALDRLQSGLYYADGTPKSDLSTVKAAARAVHGGVIAECPGLQLTPQATRLVFPTGAALKARSLILWLQCDIDCLYTVKLERLPRKRATLQVSGHVFAGVLGRIRFPPVKIPPGRYDLAVHLAAPLNAGPAVDTTSDPFSLKSSAR